MNKSRIYIVLFGFWVWVYEILYWHLIDLGRWNLRSWYTENKCHCGHVFGMYPTTIRSFFVPCCRCIFLWLEIADCGCDRCFCSCYIGPGSGLVFVDVLVSFWCLYLLLLLLRSDTLFAVTTICFMIKLLRLFCYWLRCWLEVYPDLRLHIDHVIIIGIRFGPRRPFIVNLSPYGSAYGSKDLSKGQLTGLRLNNGGSPRDERTCYSIS